MMDLLSSVYGGIDEEMQQILLKWPPFFTFFKFFALMRGTIIKFKIRIQMHSEIRDKQLKYWSEITFSYLKKSGIWESSFTQLAQTNFPLFQEQSLGYTKRLDKEEIMLVLDEMEAQGKISWRLEGFKGDFYVNKYSCYELADSIYKWAKSKGKIGSIETLKWISEGEDTESNEKFYGVREDLILKSVKVLEVDGRAQVFSLEKGKFGVKFK